MGQPKRKESKPRSVGHAMIGDTLSAPILQCDLLEEIQNLHKTPVNIVLKELLPVSRDERLKIDITAEGAMTPGYKLNEKNIQGLVSWQFRMAPLEKKEVKFGWKAVWPDNYDVSGL